MVKAFSQESGKGKQRLEKYQYQIVELGKTADELWPYLQELFEGAPSSLDFFNEESSWSCQGFCTAVYSHLSFKKIIGNNEYIRKINGDGKYFKAFYDDKFYNLIFLIDIKNEYHEKLMVLEAGFNMHYAVDHVINDETQKTLDSLTSLSVAKIYYATILLEHLGCTCYTCRLNNMLFQTLMKRGGNLYYLQGAARLDHFEDITPYPFYGEYYEAIQKRYDEIYRNKI